MHSFCVKIIDSVVVDLHGHEWCKQVEQSSCPVLTVSKGEAYNIIQLLSILQVVLAEY